MTLTMTNVTPYTTKERERGSPTHALFCSEFITNLFAAATRIFHGISSGLTASYEISTILPLLFSTGIHILTSIPRDVLFGGIDGRCCSFISLSYFPFFFAPLARFTRSG